MSLHLLSRFARAYRSSAGKSGSRDAVRLPFGWLLLGLALLLARSGAPPARAQEVHQHIMEAGTAPTAAVSIFHLDGEPVTGLSPAGPCEVVRVSALNVQDRDVCTQTQGPPCPFPGKTAADSSYVGYWDDQGASGHFVRLEDGKWVLAETTTSPVHGTGDMVYGYGTTFYRVPRDAGGSTITIKAFVQDSGHVDVDVTSPVEGPIEGGEATFAVDESAPCVVNPRHWYAARHFQFCGCHSDCVETRSFTNPVRGGQSWEIPVTSWSFHGVTYPFSIQYNSDTLVEPGAPLRPEFSGIADAGGRWSHTYSQWVDFWMDEHGVQHAVVHRGGGTQSFQSTVNGFVSANTHDRLQAFGPPVTSPEFKVADGTLGSDTLTVDYSTFVLTDGAGTRYEFNSNPAVSNQDLYWTTGNETAIPHYLLSHIIDRWGRKLHVTWTSGYVRAVKDDSGAGLTFAYTSRADGGELLASVTDTRGRVHRLDYTGITNNAGISHSQLTEVTVQGTGTPRTAYHWSFFYTDPDPAVQSTSYGGTYTGDLVIRKVEPDGEQTRYDYEPVQIPRNDPDDWDGRVTRIWWVDTSSGTAVNKEIRRQKLSDASAKLIFPGDTGFQYDYGDGGLTRLTDLATGRVWSLTYENHNLKSVRTPLEQDGGEPLVEYAYQYDTTDPLRTRVTRITTKLLQENGQLEEREEVQFDGADRPQQLTRLAPAGSGLNPQQTLFGYEGANLKTAVVAAGTLLEQTAELFYDGADGSWGLPTRARSAVGAETSTDYHDQQGWPLSVASPQNLLVPVGHRDRAPSVTTAQYNADGLPSVLTDAEGHAVSVGYAAGDNPANLVVTYTFADGKSRKAVLSPRGRLLKAIDEREVETVWSYTSEGQVKTVTRAANTGDAATTVLNYDERGNVKEVLPPAGIGSAVSFEYVRYHQDGTRDGAYEGLVTHIHYPPSDGFPLGTDKLFGYNAAGELIWCRKPDGKVITAERDKQHRVKRVVYPATDPLPGHPAEPPIEVTVHRDAFGRVDESTDPHGTTHLTYDDLNRLTGITPPPPLRALSFQYVRDTTNQRWITRVTLTGAGTWEYRADTKGRLSGILNPFGQVYTQEYYKDGNLALSTYPNGMKEERTYTDRDWLSTILHRRADNTVLDSFQYLYSDAAGTPDPTGHVRREVDSLGRTHSFSYDNLYRLTGESHPDLGSIGYAYGPSAAGKNGNRTTRVVNGVTEYLGYDPSNRLLWTNQAAPSKPTSGQAAPYRLYTYNVNGEPVLVERRATTGGAVMVERLDWNGLGRLSRVSDATGSQASYQAEYSGGGERIQAVKDGTTSDYSFGLHTAGRAADPPYTISARPGAVSAGENVTVGWTAPAGRPFNDWVGLFKVGDPNSTPELWYSYTGGAVSGSRTLAAPSTPGTYEFRYFLDNTRISVKSSNPFTVTAQQGGFANGGFAHGGADLGAAEGAESGTPEGFSVTATPPSISPGGVITGKWRAPAGRPWTDWIGLFKVGDPNSADRWWNYTGGATSGSFSIPGPAEVGAYELRYLDSSTNTITTSNRIVVGAGAWETVTTPGVGQRHAGVDQYFHPDGIGSTRYLTDNTGNTTPTGYRFDAFGAPASVSGPDTTTLKYAGGWGYESDGPGGLQQLGARLYDPEVGRFLNPDPIGLAGGLNLYAYCHNDPVGAVDPSGLDEDLLVTRFVDALRPWQEVEDAAQYFNAFDRAFHTGFRPLHQFIELHDSWRHAGWMTGLQGTPCGDTLGTVIAVGSAGVQTVAMATEIYGAGAGAVGAVGALAEGGAAESAVVSVAEGPKCFPARTPIVTRDGEKPIEEIREGDEVLSADPETGKQSYQKVTRTFVRQADALVRIVTEDGRNIEATPDHPFWVEGKGFVEARKLARSDLLRSANGCLIAVRAVTRRDWTGRVYNFRVANTHSYYAGEGRLWVHNANYQKMGNAAHAEFAEWFKTEYPGVDHYMPTPNGSGPDVVVVDPPPGFPFAFGELKPNNVDGVADGTAQILSRFEQGYSGPGQLFLWDGTPGNFIYTRHGPPKVLVPQQILPF